MQPLFLRTHKQAQLTPGHVTIDLMTVSLSAERYIDLKPLLGIIGMEASTSFSASIEMST